MNPSLLLRQMKERILPCIGGKAPARQEARRLTVKVDLTGSVWSRPERWWRVECVVCVGTQAQRLKTFAK